MPRATVLTPDHLRLVIELMRHGASRNVAAKIVGCAPSTITYTALRDRRFAAAIFRAQGRHLISLARAVAKSAPPPPTAASTS